MSKNLIELLDKSFDEILNLKIDLYDKIKILNQLINIKENFELHSEKIN